MESILQNYQICDSYQDSRSMDKSAAKSLKTIQNAKCPFLQFFLIIDSFQRLTVESTCVERSYRGLLFPWMCNAWRPGSKAMGLGILCSGLNNPAHHSPSLVLEETALASMECFLLSLCLPAWLSVETIKLHLYRDVSNIVAEDIKLNAKCPQVGTWTAFTTPQKPELCSEMDHTHLGFEGLHFLTVQILESKDMRK